MSKTKILTKDGLIVYDEEIKNYIKNQVDEIPEGITYIDPNEESTEIDTDVVSATSAKYVSYSNTDSGLEATNVQEAIDELKESIGSGSGETVNIVDNLESTSADSALSANQGRVLNEKVDEVNTYLQRDGSKNLLQITLDSGFSELGVTFTVNEDKSLTLSGTRTGFTRDLTIGKANLKAGIEYILSGCPEGGSGSTYRLMVHNDANPSAGVSDIGEGVVFTVPSDGEYIISTVLAVSYAYDGITYYPMIREATVENDTFEPYYEDAMSMANYLNDNALVHGDVVDNLASTRTDLPLSANQGRVLSDMISIGGQFRFKDFYMSSSSKLYIRFPHTSNYLPGGFAAYKASGPGNVAAALFARTTNSYSGNAPGFVVPLVTYEGCSFSKVNMDRPYFIVNVTVLGSISLWLDNTFDYYIGDNPTASDAVWTTVR